MIESLHSPHVERVKALIGSRGTKARRETGLFIAEGLQAVREALTAKSVPFIKHLYVTNSGLLKLNEFDLNEVDLYEVTDSVMAEMTSTVSPQGILALCVLPRRDINEIAPLAKKKSARIIYLHEIQDPGNAGSILRTADAMGVDAIFTSPGSVDMYSPKVVRATAGSLWHIPLFESIVYSEVTNLLPNAKSLLLSSHGTKSLLDLSLDDSYISIFGNEARGVDAQLLGLAPTAVTSVTIPMAGRAESLNLSAAASIVIFTLSVSFAG